MHRALYRKWRPMTFDDVVGQDHITRVLSQEVISSKVCHAYLFCGTRGTGKTTCAKILAKAVNCENPKNGSPCGVCRSCLSIENGSATDFLEMDAASNTGVDYIRDIKNEVVYSPSMLKNRVYIIDEVHMLSDSAFNALLKTLEEPPESVIFILATTEKQKVPATILSRCQKFDFRRIPVDIIAGRLQYISENEGIKLDSDAARMIARLSSGGMRDAISLLELCSSDSECVSTETVAASAGVISRDICVRAVNAILEKNSGEIFDIVADIYYSSSDISAFWTELMSFYRDMLVVKGIGNADSEHIRRDILDLTENEFRTVLDLSERFTTSELIYEAGVLESAFVSTIGKQGADRRLAAEMTLLKMQDPSTSLTLDSLSARVSSLEAKLISGAFQTENANQVSSGNNGKREDKQIKEEKQTVKNSSPDKEKAEKTEKTEKSGENKKGEVGKGSQSASSNRKISDWVEIVGIFRTNNAATAPFLDGSSAVIEQEKAVVYVDTPIAKMMLDMEKAPETLLGIINLKGYGAKSLEICEGAAKTEESTDDDDVFSAE